MSPCARRNTLLGSAAPAEQAIASEAIVARRKTQRVRRCRTRIMSSRGGCQVRLYSRGAHSPPRTISAAQRRHGAIGRVDTVGEHPDDEFGEGVRELGTFAL